MTDTEKKPWPYWISNWEPTLRAARKRQETDAEMKARNFNAAIADASERAVQAYDMLKSLDGRDAGGGAIFRVSGPKAEFGEGRTVKVTVGGVPVLILTFGATPDPDQGNPVGYVKLDLMKCGRAWTTSGGYHWVANESLGYSERDVADYFVTLFGG